MRKIIYSITSILAALVLWAPVPAFAAPCSAPEFLIGVTETVNTSNLIYFTGISNVGPSGCVYNNLRIVAQGRVTGTQVTGGGFSSGGVTPGAFPSGGAPAGASGSFNALIVGAFATTYYKDIIATGAMGSDRTPGSGVAIWDAAG